MSKTMSNNSKGSFSPCHNMHFYPSHHRWTDFSWSVFTLFTSSCVSCDHLCSDSYIILVRKAHKCVKLKDILWNLFASPVLIFGVRWLHFHCKKYPISSAGCYNDVGNCCNMHWHEVDYGFDCSYVTSSWWANKILLRKGWRQWNNWSNQECGKLCLHSEVT